MSITIFSLIVVQIFAWLKYRNLICPAVLHNVMWIIAACFAGKYIRSDIGIMAYIVIILGSVSFQFGFAFANKVTIHKKNTRPVRNNIQINKKIMRLLISVLAIISIPVIYQYMIYLKSTGGSLYALLKSSDENMVLPALFDYYRKFIQFLAIGFVICYWMSDKKQRKEMKIYIIILIIIACLAVISIPTRNGILFFLLPLLMAYLGTHDISDFKIMIIGVVAIGLFMGLFYFISLGKYWYIYKNSSSAITVLTNEISTYLSGGIAAFCNVIKNHVEVYKGKNTFRFLFAIGDKIFGTSNAVNLVNEFTVLADQSKTNVYTFYDFYVRDFGCVYAVFMQFIVGIVHGISYKGMKKKSLIQIYYFAMLSYPLIMQFFQDQYVSLLSTWIQIIIVGVVIYKTSIFVISKPIEQNSNREKQEALG